MAAAARERMPREGTEGGGAGLRAVAAELEALIASPDARR